MVSEDLKDEGERTTSTPLLPQQLKEALMVIFGKGSLEEREVDDLANFILNFFGFEDYLLDNILEQRERDVFYLFEEMGILKTVQEETSIYRGKCWRIHYWVINRELIDAALNGKILMEENPPLPELLYRRLDEEVWERKGPDRVAE